MTSTSEGRVAPIAVVDVGGGQQRDPGVAVLDIVIATAMSAP
jgi:hypothetical protein